MHHINKNEWKEYLKQFCAILKNEGILLIGGHSTNDTEFKNGYRISPTTGYKSYAVDKIESLAIKKYFNLEDSGIYKFEEAFSSKPRAFKYFFFRKK